MLASGEWAYRSHGVQRLSNVSRIVTFVRSPLMHVRSQVWGSLSPRVDVLYRATASLVIIYALLQCLALSSEKR